ncbi:hypothetical protein ACH5RR_036074 [Cinchona calisaya]|uniref:Uncharacterized protein n=1 Tax=Cinchona calisaya TaxID=153742 RepID=A0ABD2Y741_9GENT
MVRRAASSAVLIVIWIIVLFHLLETSIALLVPRPFLPYSANNSTEVSLRCYHWGKCKHEPSATYEGREITVFDEVELYGISIFDLDRKVEQAEVYGHKRYYVLIEEHGFRELTHSRELQEHYEDTGNDEDDQSLEGEDGRGDENDRGGGDKGTGDRGTEEAGNRSDKGTGAKGAEEAGDSDFSRKDSDYEEEHDDEEYEENVDHEAEWLGVAKQ